MRAFPSFLSQIRHHFEGDDDGEHRPSHEAAGSGHYSNRNRAGQPVKTNGLADNRHDNGFASSQIQEQNESMLSVEEDYPSKSMFHITRPSFNVGLPKVPSKFQFNKGREDSPKHPHISPFALYPNEELSPRSSVWLYLSAASLAGLSTFLVVEDSATDRNNPDTVLLSILSISFALSFAVTLCYRHRTIREGITKDVPKLSTSWEFIVSALLFILWCTALRYVMDPVSGVQYGMTNKNDTDGLGEEYQYMDEVWNGNLWLSSWLGGGLSAYLVGSLMMASPHRKRGVVVLGDSSIEGTNGCGGTVLDANNIDESGHSDEVIDGYVYRRKYASDEEGPSYWFLSLAVSAALAAFSVEMRTSDSCQGGVLSSTPYCKRSVLSASVAFICAIIAAIALILCRLNQMKVFDDWRSHRERKLWSIEGGLAILSFALNGINVGFSTSPGGQSTELGNLFITSWLGFILSFMICERLLNMWTLRVVSSVDDEAFAGKVKGSTPNGTRLVRKASSSKQSPAEILVENKEQDLEMGHTNVMRTPRNDSKRVFISRTQEQNVDDDGSSSSSASSSSASSSSNSSSDSSSGEGLDTSNEQTYSSYSLPTPPRTVLDESTTSPTLTSPSAQVSSRGWTSVSSSSSTEDVSIPLPPPPYNSNDKSSFMNETVDPDNNASGSNEDDDEDSAAELCFEPDDVSSLGCSMFSIEPSTTTSTVDPDGYKSEDNYTAAPFPPKNSGSKVTKRSVPKKQQTFPGKRSSLATVEESIDTTGKTSSNGSSGFMSQEKTPQSTVEEIMNRGVTVSQSKKKLPKRPKQSQPKVVERQSSMTDEEVISSKVKEIAKSFSRKGRLSGGPPTFGDTGDAIATKVVDTNNVSFLSKDDVSDSDAHSA
eukprot:scaffold2040_cov196-Alexandrium_tamarense.AAC.13